VKTILTQEFYVLVAEGPIYQMGDLADCEESHGNAIKEAKKSEPNGNFNTRMAYQ
jgi:hypothetical protein